MYPYSHSVVAHTFGMKFNNCKLNLNATFNTGSVHIGIKDLTFEPSNPFQHLQNWSSSRKKSFEKPVLFLYTDGDPTIV